MWRVNIASITLRSQMLACVTIINLIFWIPKLV